MNARKHVTAYHVPVLLIGLALGGWILPAPAHACSCLKPTGPWEARARSDAVFSGTATDVKRAGHALRVTFRVDHSWKGALSGRVVLSTGASSAACGFPFRENQAYLVYAEDNGGRFSTDLCTRTSLLEHAQEDIEAFEKTIFLGSNYPDPFNPVTTIVVGLPAPADISLKVYDRSGQLIKTLVDGRQPAGAHRITFDGSDLPSGIYFYRLRAGDLAQTKTMVLLR